MSAGAVMNGGGDLHARRRRRMVEEQLRGRDIKDQRVLAAMGRIPRHRFVQEALASRAYQDSALPIGFRQTISQPYMVATMCQLLELQGGERVLEIGTGCGYQTAVLRQLAEQVYTIERIELLLERAARNLGAILGDQAHTIHFMVGDGYLGWPDAAPFDAIVTAAAAPEIPQALLDQLAPGGRLVMPVGGGEQTVVRVTRTGQGLKHEHFLPCLFVPMLGGVALGGEE